MNEDLYNKRTIAAFKKESGSKTCAFEITPKEGFLMLVAGESIAWASKNLQEEYETNPEAFAELDASAFEVADADYKDDDDNERTTTVVYKKAVRKVVSKQF